MTSIILIHWTTVLNCSYQLLVPSLPQLFYLLVLGFYFDSILIFLFPYDFFSPLNNRFWPFFIKQLWINKGITEAFSHTFSTHSINISKVPCSICFNFFIELMFWILFLWMSSYVKLLESCVWRCLVEGCCLLTTFVHGRNLMLLVATNSTLLLLAKKSLFGFALLMRLPSLVHHCFLCVPKSWIWSVSIRSRSFNHLWFIRIIIMLIFVSWALCHSILFYFIIIFFDCLFDFSDFLNCMIDFFLRTSDQSWYFDIQESGSLLLHPEAITSTMTDTVFVWVLNKTDLAQILIVEAHLIKLSKISFCWLNERTLVRC